MNMGRLDNKVVLITGSSGMGAAAARLAADEGRACLYRGVGAGGMRVSCRRKSAEAGARATYRTKIMPGGSGGCVAHFGRIDGVFNVAGISGRRFGDGPLHECSAEGWDTLMNINLRSLFLVSREVVRHMLSAQRMAVLSSTWAVSWRFARAASLCHSRLRDQQRRDSRVHDRNCILLRKVRDSNQRDCSGIGGNTDESSGRSKTRISGVYANKTTACEGIYGS